MKKAAQTLIMKIGTLSRIYSEQDDSSKREGEKVALSIPIPHSVYIEMISRLKK